MSDNAANNAAEPSTPDSISMKDLVSFQESATKEDEVTKMDGPIAGWTKDALCDMVSDKLSEISDLCNHPLSHKVALFMIAENMIQWHTKMGVQMMQEGETDSGVAWLRDAGKFQSIANIASCVSLGPEDFTCTDYEADEAEEDSE